MLSFRFRDLLFSFTSLICLLASPALWAQGTVPVLDENGWYGIVARSSGRSLEVKGASQEAGAPIVQWEFTHPASQQWRFVRVVPGGEYYRIENRQSGKCLTVDKPDENSPLVQRPWTGSFYQQWKMEPGGFIGSVQLVVKGNNNCAAIVNADKFNGTAAVLQRPQNRATQQWRLFQLRLNEDPSLPGFGTPELLPSLNSSGNELHPVLAPDGNTLYLSRTRYTANTEGNTESGDAWVSSSPNQGHTWNAPTRLDVLNTPQNNGVMAVVGPQGNTLLLRGTYERDGSFRDEGVSELPRTAGKGVRPVPLSIQNYYSAGQATTFFMTPDKKVLLLSLERGDTQGGNDLYLSTPTAGGVWSEPRSLGSVVNSPGFEFAPWLAPDNKTLYFSSYGHAGYGSADIFVSTRLDDTWMRWSEPRNLGNQLNGPGFDAYFMLAPDGKQAYYTSARTANGPADIYRTATNVQRTVASDSTAPVAATPVVPPVPAVVPRTLLTGRVLNAKTKQPLAAEIKIVRLDNNLVFNATARSLPGTGSYQFTLPPGRYQVLGSSETFLNATDTVTMTGSRTLDLLLVPAAVGSSLELPTLIFAQGKFTLLPPSYGELNRLARTLADNPTVNIRLEGHTDNQGPADLNQKLSEERVGEVRRYLIMRGVPEDRISVVGYGGTHPRASNEREETRRLNRRVEFTIVK
ncbi:RICIN domain-containing protein [Hymenobacter sp.]|jgi:outer membrane protein OmpA-like peptidoglycan-associated protein|uniref:RICIN domain-containing protein n=1 Tax=Hymenobacter sp. TaxID=1898978 RepID=UPI002ED9EE1B